MRKYSGLLPLIIAAALTLTILSGCTGTVALIEYEQLNVQYDIQLTKANESSYSNTLSEPLNTIITEDVYIAETYQKEEHGDCCHDSYAIGGYDYMGCIRHWGAFHTEGVHMILGSDVICIEEGRAWSRSQRELQEHPDDCLVNLFTMIQYFNISRDVFQSIIDTNLWHWFWFDETSVDILYSGDRALVDQFFAYEGQADQESRERYYWHWRNNIITAQQIVNENNTEMSRYFHDIWSYLYFSAGRSQNYRWMRGWIDAGEYDRVNIVQFINNTRLYQESHLTPGISAFEHWASLRNLNIYTHYNFEVLLSGDWDLIRSYYCITNEPLHTAQVQARFNAYVAANGMPDTSWMLPRTNRLTLSGFPPSTNINPHTGRTFTVQVTTSPGIEFAVSIEADNEDDPTQQWITIDPITQPNQSGVGSFRVAIAPNQSFDGRTGTITVTAPNATPQTITLPQGGVPVYLDVFPQAITPLSTGGNTTISVWSNNTWQIHSTVPWLSVYSAYPQNQTGWGNFVLHAEPNTGFAPRLGQIILSSRDVTTLIHVTQNNVTPGFQLSTNGMPITEWNTTHLSESVSINVTVSRPWEINIPEHAHEWLSVSNITGQTGPGTFQLNTAVNNNNTARQARVTVTSGIDTRHIDVTQTAFQTTPELAVVFHFDGQAVELPLTNEHINTSQVPTPATRYGQPSIPGQAFMGWFTEIFEGMHFVHNQNRATPFDLSQAITWGMTDANGRLHLHASWSHFGDVNGDGIIDTLDMLQLADVISGRIPVSHLNFRPSDVNVDGRVDPVDRSLLLMHVLGAPGVILGPHNPNIVPGSYLLSFNFGRQVIDIPIANGGIDTALITEAELLDWEMELLNVLYDAYQQGERTAGFAVYVTALDSATSYVMELDLSAMGAVTAEVISEMRASYAVMAGAFVLDSSVEGN